jgi:hypothetical protein
MWDYLFGTVYDPGKKPGDLRHNWGLYYDYPKDYFLQHAFSVKRFDEQKLLRYNWFNWYYNLRPRMLKWLGDHWDFIRGKKQKPGKTFQDAVNMPEPVTELAQPQENYLSCDK